MTNSRELGFGIIGSGMIANYHALAISECAGARLVGVASRNAATAETLATKHGAAVHTTDIAALVAREDIQVICITTPSGAHLEPALAALRAGKHLVIEKPLEITVERVDELLAAAARAGVVVAPIFQARFGANARLIKTALETGRFGRLVLASAYVKWHRATAYYQGWKGTKALDGGGATMNQGIHGIDLLQWFAGMPVEVFGRTTRRVHTGIESEDTAVATLRYADGALGTIETSTAAWPGWSRRIELCGEQGSVCLEDDTITQWDFRTTQPGDEAIRHAGADTALGSGSSDPKAISHQGHLRQIQDLVKRLRDGTPLGIDGLEARKSVSLICALYASAASGQPVVPR
ncbi:MAG: Gfo/Idh/MocA family oxidoreductase [Cephaloticoccus sp.]|nr:Gfo/Idh/MocA family oxidoreductase [Cephaloticoccus sp.]MCF7759367.1 Gfo/Idh/MocA family oxidoreductase [Cephaloticoccus sp.]